MGWTHFRAALGQEPPRWAYPHWARGRRAPAQLPAALSVVAPRRTGLLDRVIDALASRRAAYSPVAMVAAEQRVSDGQLVITRALALSGEPSAANTLAVSAPISLLSGDRPRLMQQWRLRSIVLPIGVLYEAAGKSSAVATLRVSLLRGGDIVWTSAANTEREAAVHNFIVDERFETPIIVSQGQSLALSVSLTANNITPTTVQVWVAAQFLKATAGEANTESAEGRIHYQAVSLDGRRRL